MPVYVTPYYDSRGPQIDVGAFSNGLSTASAGSIREVTASMKRQWNALPIEAMYVVAIRLYDFGLKDEAVYWFHSATYRARLLKLLVPRQNVGGIGSAGFERIQAYLAFHQLAGEYINGYAFGDLPTLQHTLEIVKAENSALPRFKQIYPDLELIAEGAWAEKNQEIAAGLGKLVNYITNSADQIKATRKQNGMEGKY